MAEKEWTDAIMLHDWPECGPGRLTLEQLYQMFKARMVEEVSAVKQIDANCFAEYALRDSSRTNE